MMTSYGFSMRQYQLNWAWAIPYQPISSFYFYSRRPNCPLHSHFTELTKAQLSIFSKTNRFSDGPGKTILISHRPLYIIYWKSGRLLDLPQLKSLFQELEHELSSQFGAPCLWVSFLDLTNKLPVYIAHLPWQHCTLEGVKYRSGLDRGREFIFEVIWSL